MKKLKTQAALLAIVATGAMMGSCSRETDLYNPNYSTEKYQTGWQNRFGTVDVQQNWNTATQARAAISLDGTYTVRIYTKNPVNNDARLLAKATVGPEGTTLVFDMEKATTSVFVTATGPEGLVVNGYFQIANGQLSISRSAAQARTTRATGACPTTIGEPQVRTMDNGWRQENGTGDWKEYSFSETVYTLNNVVMSTDVEPWRMGDFRAIFGQNGPFEEQQNNLTRYDGQFAGNVEYVMQATGPVDMTLNYSVTSGLDLFGYYYWKEGEDPAQARKLLLTDKAPSSYISMSYDGNSYSELTPNQNLLNWNNDNIMTRGTRFSLVYFDEQGNASFDFPAGTHIAFFIDHNKKYDYIFNSLAEYNDWTRAYYSEQWHDRAVSYNFRGTTILGFEDWTDFDENDIVFFATGNFRKPIDVETGEDPNDDDDFAQPQSWIIACEDLGSTDDYDFNDIVFSVAHAAGQTTAVVTPLAAGGVYPATIYLGATALGEVHQLIDPDAQPNAAANYDMLNTYSRGTAGQAIEVTVPSDFTVAYDSQNGQNMGGFAIGVITPDDRLGIRAVTIGAPTFGTAPQMILVPGNWQWPTERTPIEQAYPNFALWSQNAGAFTSWYDTVVSDKVAR